MNDALLKIQSLVEDEARSFAANFVANRQNFLDKKKINATGGLRESIKSQLVNQAASGILELLIEFEEHGRFIDMKRMNMAKGGGDYILALENWLKERGFFQKFRQKYEDKYESNRKFQRIGTGLTRDARALNRMAWGIAIARSGQGKYRRRRWYNKPKTAAIGELYNQILANLPNIASEALLGEFN